VDAVPGDVVRQTECLLAGFAGVRQQGAFDVPHEFWDWPSMILK
jgi:hypothetical protein